MRVGSARRDEHYAQMVARQKSRVAVAEAEVVSLSALLASFVASQVTIWPASH